MDNIIFADDAARGVTDISGVKNAVPSIPDGADNGESRVADGADNAVQMSEIGVTGAIESEVGFSDEAELDAEFEALIRGKYRQAYRKRTEGIIRKRLRSGKARPWVSAESSEAQNTDETTEIPVTGAAVLSEKAADGEIASAQMGELSSENNASEVRYERLRTQNQNRPIENGLSGSCGIVTKINVSALDGQGVLAILKRVGSGEKISFK